MDGQLIYVWPEIDLVFVRFTNYEHVGDKNSSVIDISTSYQNTDSGNLPTSKLEELLYNVGDNLIMDSTIMITTIWIINHGYRRTFTTYEGTAFVSKEWVLVGF